MDRGVSTQGFLYYPQLLLGDLGQVSWLLGAAVFSGYKGEVATEMQKTLLM